MSFCVIYSVVLVNHSVQNSPWGRGPISSARSIYRNIYGLKYIYCVLNIYALKIIIILCIKKLLSKNMCCVKKKYGLKYIYCV